MELPEDRVTPVELVPVLPAKRRGGLSLRVTLGAMAIVALGLGLWANHARQVRAGLEMIRQHRGMYYYDFEYVNYVFVAKPKSWAPRWLINLVGIECLHDVNYVRIVDPVLQR